MKPCAALGLILVVLLLQSGCSPVGVPASAPFSATLDQVLERLPARDTLEARWLVELIVLMGTDSVVALCDRLEPGGSDRNARAELALQRVAEYVVSRGTESERLMFVSALGRALNRPRPPQQTSFILARLQVAGKRESIGTLSRFLTDDRLCEPAAQAMVTIRDGAESALLSALPHAGKPCCITILKSLGDIRGAGAVEAMLMEAASDDREVRRAAIYGLANIGDVRAEPILEKEVARSSSRDRDEYLSYLLLFARRQIEAGNSALAIRIANQHCSGELLPRDNHLRAAGLGLLVLAKGERAVDDLLRVMADTSRQLRSAALEQALQILVKSLLANGWPHWGRLVRRSGRRSSPCWAGVGMESPLRPSLTPWMMVMPLCGVLPWMRPYLWRVLKLLCRCWLGFSRPRSPVTSQQLEGLLGGFRLTS